MDMARKEIFFNLLNKYKTITAILNNQQDWLAFLPKKSMIQIITYYELLKNNYKTLQRQQQQQQQQRQRQNDIERIKRVNPKEAWRWRVIFVELSRYTNSL